MPYINVNDVYIMDNTGKQADDAVDYALANSNRNLLDNPWWGSGEVVNQRSVTAKPSNGAYWIDRWICSSGADANALSIGSAGVTFTIASSAMWPAQKLANISALFGETLTASVLLSNGTIKSGTATITSSASATFVNDSALTITLNTAGTFQLAIKTTSTIRAVKLEKGSYSTLANDVPPDYGTELRKCMYYFQRIRQKNSYTLCVGFGEAMNSTTNIRITIPTAVPMRHQASAMSAVPTGTGTMYIVGNGQLLPVTAVSGLGVTGNAVTVNVTVSTAGAYNHIYGLRFTNNSTYIDLSADL